MKQDNLPLSGVRVCDLTQVMFGPCATQVLGDYGAEITKIERPKVGDLSRTYDHFAEPGEESAYYMAMNRNKRSIAVDVGRAEGLEVVRKLALASDVLVENFRPGVAARLGLDYESLHKENPRLIYASGSGFGSSGPLMHKGGQDFLAQAMSGLADRNRDASGRPQLYPTAIGDFSAGMILVQGILLALLHRERTGLGQRVEANLLDTLLVMQQQEATQVLLRGKQTNWLQQNPMDIFATKDGFVAFLGVFKPDPVALLCKALGMEDLTLRPEFGTIQMQVQNRERLRSELGPSFLAYSTEECLARMEQQDLLCAPVLSLGDALSHPQVSHNKLVVEFEHSVHGQVRTTGSALKMSMVDATALRPPSTLGLDLVAVLEDAGFSQEVIQGLRSDGVVQ